MKITFYIPLTQAWNRAHMLTLAREQAVAGYDVRVINAGLHSTVSEDGVSFVNPRFFAANRFLRMAWVFWYFATRTRGIVHIAGLRGGFIVLLLRILHPSSRIIVHADDVSNPGTRNTFSAALALRFAHMCVVSRQDLLHHEAFLKYSIQYVPYAIPARLSVTDPSILRAHGLELQQFFLGYANPSRWRDLQVLVKDWRESVRPHIKHAKLAIVFTEDMPSQHIAFGHDVVILGFTSPYVEQMLKAGARAVFTPSLTNYRFELISAMSAGKYAVPLHELVNRNPFALEELAHMYRADDHALSDVHDAALTMSWGHVARHIIASDHDPVKIALHYEDMYGQLLFADKVTAKARLS